MVVNFKENPKTLADELYHRWKKRIFPNDVITRRFSAEGYDEIVITRGKYEASMTVSPNAYKNPRFMMDADANMRFMLNSIRNKVNEGAI